MKRFTINEPSFIDRFFKANGPPPRVPGLALTIEIGDKAPAGSFTAGVCSRCGAPCSSQMVRYTPSTGKADALCGTCLTREAEMRSPDWFAAEERATR